MGEEGKGRGRRGREGRRTEGGRRRGAEAPAHRHWAASLGHTVRVLRTELGLSRGELAERAGLSYSYLSEIEKGTKQPSTRSLRAIAGGLGVPPELLLADAERRARAPHPDAARAGVTRALAQRLYRDALAPLAELRAERPAAASMPPVLEPDEEAAPRAVDEEAARAPRAGAAPVAAAEEAGVFAYEPGFADEEELEGVALARLPGAPRDPLAELAELLPLLGPEDRELLLRLARRLAERD